MHLANQLRTSFVAWQICILSLFALILTACDINPTIVTDSPVYDSKLTIIPMSQVDGSSDTLTQVGLPFQFMAVEEVDGQYKNVTDQVTWHTSNYDVAMIKNGQVIGQNKGIATIHVQLAPNETKGLSSTNDVDSKSTLASPRMSNKIELIVKDEPLLVLQINTNEDDHPIGTLNHKLPVGAKQSLNAIATYADHTSFNVTNLVDWVTETNGIIHVNNKTTAQMQAQGHTNLHATLFNGSDTTRAENRSNTLAFTVTEATITSLSVTPLTASTAAHSQRQFTAIATYSDGTIQDVTKHAIWKSSAQSVAIMNGGDAETLSMGSSTISAQFLGKDSSATLSVTNAKLEALQITPSKPMLNVGDELFYKVKAIYDDGSTDDISRHVLWKSSQPEVSNVVASYAKAANVGKTQISAHYQGKSSNISSLTVSAHQLLSLQITPPLTELAKGTQAELIATAIYDDGETLDLSDKVTWHTTEPDVAYITAGHIAAISAGKTDIYAVFNGIVGNKVQIRVIEPSITALQITPALETVPISGIVDYVAQATFQEGEITTTQDVSHLVAWSSGSTEIASLANASATGLSKGATTVNVLLNKEKQSANLIVSDKKLVKLQITPAQSRLPVGMTRQYTATAFYNGGSNEDVTELVNWSSSSSAIATIYAGEVEAVRAGVVNINASYLTIKSNQATLTVEDITLSEIQVTPSVSSMAKGTTLAYVATGIYSDFTTQDITSQASWASSDTQVATVVQSKTFSEKAAITKTETAILLTEALVTAAAVGSSDITARLDNVTSNMAKLTVTPAYITDIYLTPTDKEIIFHTSSQFKAYGIYNDGTNQDITYQANWSSSDPSLATVIDGMVTVHKLTNEKVTIKVSFEGESKKATVTVLDSTLKSISVEVVGSDENKNIGKGNSQSFIALGTYSNKDVIDLTEDPGLSWSTDSNNLTIDNKGIATAINPQNGIIITASKASTNDPDTSLVTGTIMVNTTSAVINRLEIRKIVEEHDAIVTSGTVFDVQAFAIMSDGTASHVSTTNNTFWSEDSNSEHAVVNRTGRITARAPGISNVKARYQGISASEPIKITVVAVEDYTNQTCKIPTITMPYGKGKLTFDCPANQYDFVNEEALISNGKGALTGRTVAVVSYKNAEVFCVQKGKRLPTSAELGLLVRFTNEQRTYGSNIYTAYDWHMMRHYWSSKKDDKYYVVNMHNRHATSVSATDLYSVSCVKETTP